MAGYYGFTKPLSEYRYACYKTQLDDVLQSEWKRDIQERTFAYSMPADKIAIRDVDYVDWLIRVLHSQNYIEAVGPSAYISDRNYEHRDANIIVTVYMGSVPFTKYFVKAEPMCVKG